MNDLLIKILETGIVTDENNNKHILHSHTRKDQGLYLQNILESTKPEISIEVGLAYGISTLFICESLKKNKMGHHIVMDPFQQNWKNIGLKNIKDAGYSELIEFHEEFADRVLSRLFVNNTKVDFAYLDGSKVFDIVLFNVYILSRILNINGIIVLDDCSFPGIKKLVRFLNCHPAFEFHSGFKMNKLSFKRKFVRILSKNKTVRKILNPEFTINDENQNLDYHCIAFKKVKEDDRPWNWHCEF